jgi:hypothetical protein
MQTAVVRQLTQVGGDGGETKGVNHTKTEKTTTHFRQFASTVMPLKASGQRETDIRE